MNKNLILLIATTVLLIASLISAGTLGWFETSEKVYVESINASVQGVVDIEISKEDDVIFKVPDGYSTTGIAPGCLGYFGINLSNEQGSSTAIVSISVDFDSSKIPSNLQFYKGNNFDPSTATLPDDHNTMWSQSNIVSRTGQRYIFDNFGIAKEEAEVVYIAFFWPYDSPNTSSQTTEDTNYGLGVTEDFSIKLTVSTVTG